MNRYKYDTHVHTSEVSFCSNVKAETTVKLYKEAGYQGIFITDHYFDGYFEFLRDLPWKEKIDIFLSSYRAARKEGEKVGLDVFLGIELRFHGSPNDYLVFGIDEDFLADNKELYKVGLEAFHKIAQENGLIIVQAHPYRAWSSISPAHLIDGVEIFNGNPRHDSHNDLAYSFALENNLLMTSGSDFHQLEDLARGGIITSEKISSPKDLAAMLKEGSVIELIGSPN